MLNQVAKNILATITYYDILDYPMTAFEIWKYILRSQDSILSTQSKNQNEAQAYEAHSLFEIIKELEGDELRQKIASQSGFYFLRGRQELVNMRLERNKISEKKYKIISRVAFWLRAVPYVRMIAVTGRVAMKNAEERSDLDLLIAIEKGHIFTGRLLVTLFVHLMGKRRHGLKIKNRICLNYFIATDSLEISIKDMFSSSEYFFMLPLFGKQTFAKFQESNMWIRDYHMNFHSGGIDNLKMLPDNLAMKFIRWLGEKIFSPSFVEEYLKKWQLKRINNDSRTHQEGSMVMADDNALVFLPSPQGPGVFEKFRERMEKYS